MNEKELNDKLNSLKKKLKEANTKGNPDKIDYYLKGLNELWQKASIKMLKNAAKDGFVPNKKN
tara:strand:+ start:297 stop:485 length:189 start_codon:yes stop_codon:yes gene_type:complete